jgi:hypothetical protein
MHSVAARDVCCVQVTCMRGMRACIWPSTRPCTISTVRISFFPPSLGLRWSCTTSRTITFEAKSRSVDLSHRAIVSCRTLFCDKHLRDVLDLDALIAFGFRPCQDIIHNCLKIILFRVLRCIATCSGGWVEPYTRWPSLFIAEV